MILGACLAAALPTGGGAVVLAASQARAEAGGSVDAYTRVHPGSPAGVRADIARALPPALELTTGAGGTAVLELADEPLPGALVQALAELFPDLPVEALASEQRASLSLLITAHDGGTLARLTLVNRSGAGLPARLAELIGAEGFPSAQMLLAERAPSFAQGEIFVVSLAGAVAEVRERVRTAMASRAFTVTELAEEGDVLIFAARGRTNAMVFVETDEDDPARSTVVFNVTEAP